MIAHRLDSHVKKSWSRLKARLDIDSALGGSELSEGPCAGGHDSLFIVCGLWFMAWRKTGSPNHHDGYVDLDQQVFNKGLLLATAYD